MKLEQSDSPFIFSSTSLPDVFFTEYLSYADGNYIKIYLYMVFLAKYGKYIKVNDLAKKLQLPLKTIQEGIKFWEEQHIITKKNTGYILNNLQEIELHKLYNPKITSSNIIQTFLYSCVFLGLSGKWLTHELNSAPIITSFIRFISIYFSSLVIFCDLRNN